MSMSTTTTWFSSLFADSSNAGSFGHSAFNEIAEEIDVPASDAAVNNPPSAMLMTAHRQHRHSNSQDSNDSSGSNGSNGGGMAAKMAFSPPPPTFSRMPPDGHEFPPDYRDPNGQLSQVRRTPA